MNAQDITRETYDSVNRAQKVNVVAGTISSSGQATITPLQAWPDPKTYIGLVTVTGNLSASLGGNVTLNPSQNWIGLATVTTSNPGSFSGNVTLDPGSKTQIVGNVTLSDSKTFIGLTTSVIGNSPILGASTNYIGLVTVANVVSTTFSGNVTLDAGSKTQIVGNVTLSDPKTYIGLTSVSGTVGISSIPSIYGKMAVAGNTAGDGTGNWRYLLTDDDGNLQIEVANNISLGAGTATIGIVRMGSLVTLAPSPNYIGLVSISHAAWADPKTFLGLTTSVIGNAPILGSSTNYIGLVTVANTVSTTFSGNVTLDAGSKTQIVGNMTLSDSKGFIGLTTVTGSALDIRSLNSTATLFAVVNTGAVGNTNALATLLSSPNWIGLTTTVVGNSPILGASTNYIGLVTVANTVSTTFSGNVTLDAGSKTQIVGNITISDSKGYIGLVSTSAWTDPKAYIGLATVTGNIDIRSLNSTATLFAVVNTGAATDPKIYIGLTTTTLGTGDKWIGLASISGNVGFSGNVTLDAGSKTQIVGNVTLSDSKGFIGLTTSVIGNALILGSSTNYIGLVTVANTVSTTFSGNVTLDAGSKTQIVGNMTLSDSKGYIGLVSISHSAWADPKTFIGLATSVIGNAPILGASTNYIGLVTVANTVSTTFSGNVTLDAGSKTQIVGNVTISDSKGYIGLVSISHAAWADPKTYIGLVTVGNTVSTTFSGNVTLDAGSKTQIAGNITISDSKGFIGLTTSIIGNAPILGASTNYIGLVTVANTVTVGAHALTAGAAYIGLASVNISPIPVGTSYIGLVTNTLAAVDTKSFLGLTTVVQGGGGTKYIGLTTTTLGVGTSFVGLVTSVGGVGTSFIGLVTAVPTYLSTYTAVQAIVSANGNNTIFVAPASKYFVVKDLIVGSLGRAEVKFMEEGTTLIPYIALATTGGYVSNFGDAGLRAGTVQKSLVAALNAAATISVMANVRFE